MPVFRKLSSGSLWSPFGCHVGQVFAAEHSKASLKLTPRCIVCMGACVMIYVSVCVCVCFLLFVSV